MTTQNRLFIINFTVNSKKLDDINLFRGIYAKDETDLSKKLEMLQHNFQIIHDEWYDICSIWDTTKAPFFDIPGFILTDNKINGKE